MQSNPEFAMRKRWLIGLFIVIVACGALILAFPITLVVPMGFVKQEAFFDGKPTSYWVRALKHEGYLGHAPPSGDIGKNLRDGGAQAVPVLCELAENPDADVRSDALYALHLVGKDVGKEAKAAEPVLTSTIQKEDHITRFLVASRALAEIDRPAAVELLSGIIKDKSVPARRAWSFTVLLELVPDCEGAIPVANELFHQPQEDPRLRVQAMKLLWRLNQPIDPLVAGLLEIAKDEKNPAGNQALNVIGEMGPAAKSGIPDLLKMLDSKTLAISGQYWGPPNRWNVCRTLGLIGPDAKAAVPVLIAMLKNDKYRSIFRHLATALPNLGPTAKQGVPILLELIKNKKGDDNSLRDIRIALVKLDPEAAARAGISATEPALPPPANPMIMPGGKE
jgi:HEAT repeat protein